jgi:hypothetical protein
LDEILSVNEEAQQCYQDLKETVLVLENVPHLEPPPELKSDVIAQIALSQARQRKRKSSHWFALSPMIDKFQPRLAFAFGAGVLITIVAVLILQLDLSQKSDLNLLEYYGTIGINEESGFQTIHRIPIARSNLSGFLLHKQSHRLVSLELNLIANQSHDLIIEFDPEKALFAGFWSFPEVKTFQLGDETGVIQTSISDTSRFALLFNSIGSTHIHLSILSGERVIFKDSVPIDR